MFSSQPQASTPWAQKTTPLGTPAAQPPPQSTPGTAFGTPGTAFGTPNPVFGTPAAPGALQGAAQSQFGTPTTQSAPWLYTQQSPAPNTLGASLPSSDVHPPPHVTQSPADQGPVGYIPGYLSRLRGGERPAASASRGAEEQPMREADTSLAVRDLPPRAAPSTSPSTRFSSSFFNGDRASRSPSVAPFRESSIFGHGGLRGSRREDADRSMSLRLGTSPDASPAVTHEPFAFGTSLEDDDAPPQDTLAEMAFPQVQVPVYPAAHAAPLATSAASAAAAPPQAPLSQRTIIIYGFPRFLRDSVLGTFASETLVSVQDVDVGAVPAGVSVEALPSAAQLVYAEPLHAMHALRRSGELVAGCLVGVRWEDDSMHRLSLGKGLDAPLLAEVGSGAAPATPARHASSIGAARPAPQTPAGTPLIGRPIEVVGAPGSILARPAKNAGSASATPLRAAANVGESLWKNVSGAPSAPTPAGASATLAQGTSTTAPPTSMLGRLADGLFGW